MVESINYISNNKFSPNTKKTIESCTYSHYYKYSFKKLYIDDLKIHGFRHGFTTTRYIESNSKKKISILLRNSKIHTILSLYVILVISEKTVVLNDIDA